MRNEGSGWTTVSYLGGSGNDFLQNNATGIGTLRFVGGEGQNALENNADEVSNIELFGSIGADTLANDGDFVDGITFNAFDGSNRFINSGHFVRNVVYSGGAGTDRILDYGFGLSMSSFSTGAGNDQLVLRGYGASGVTFDGGDGSDVFQIEATAHHSNSLEFVGGEDSAADFLVNLADDIFGLYFDGGAGADSLQNNGSFAEQILFYGGGGDDTLLNKGFAVSDVTFYGRDGNDTLENRGADGGAFRMFGDTGNDVLFQSSGQASSLRLEGGDGNDVLQNYCDALAEITLLGDDGNDTLINGGDDIGTIWLTGSAGNNRLRNYGDRIQSIVVSDEEAITGASVAVQNSGSFISSISINSRIALMLNSSGSHITSIDVDGGDESDTITIEGTELPSTHIDGRSGDDTVSITASIPTSSIAHFDGSNGNDVFIVEGTFSSIEWYGGEGDDTAVFAASADSAILSGGHGDDSYQFSGTPSGNITLTESWSGEDDASRDTLDFSGFLPGAVSVDLSNTSPQQQPSESGTLWLSLSDENGFENIVGTSFADVLLGNARPNLLTGARFLPNGLTTSATPVVWNREQWVLLDFESRTNEGEFDYTTDDVAAIVQRLRDIYTSLPVHFVTSSEELPEAVRHDGQFVTIYFNETPSTGRPGGEASEIDPGNMNPGGEAFVQISGMLGGREVLDLDYLSQLTASEQLDGDEIQAPNLAKPASTSANLRALSAKIAAHELGHLLGMRHYDAFGPIGFGINGPPGASLFVPAYGGLSAAFETADHIISSPAAVGTTRFNDLRNLYFGEREAIKLALAFSDSAQIHTAETSQPHQEINSASPVTLKPLDAPSFATSGYVQGKSSRADALMLSGTIGFDGGHSESDWYSFNASAGDVFSFEVLSRSLARYNSSSSTSIDSIIRVYGQNGQLIQSPNGPAFNDDDFETSDSALLDVTFREAGIYYIEVDTFHRSSDDPGYDRAISVRDELRSRRDDDDPLNDLSSAEADFLKRLEDSIDDTDSGSYELLAYRSSRVSTHDEIDSMQGGPGVDILQGGPGDDYSIVVQAETPLMSIPETSDWYGSLVFGDRGGFTWMVSVDYGDGSTWESTDVLPNVPIFFDHAYTDDGTYVVTVTIANDDGLVTSTSLVAVVTNVSPVASVDGNSWGVAGGTVQLSSTAFDPAGDADPLSYYWVVTLGSTVITTQSGGTSFVFVPMQTGQYRVTLTVDDGDGGVTSAFKDVTIVPPARVSSTAIDDGTAQRSMIRSLTISFDQFVTVLPGAFTVAKRGGGTVPLLAPQINVAGGKTVVILRFASGQHVGPGNSLEDGNYEVRIDPSRVLFGGAGIDGDNNGLAGGMYVFGNQATHKLFRLFGDANGDRVVNTADTSLFNATYRKISGQAGYNFAFDYDGDGDVDALDYLYMRNQINKTMSFF
ncbi:MAG: pre-peptidase C-terminal domain-containing protein [Planctomycetaceae bacterium]|nr:pre-peptidase C-terminal domain-containing protein [Planctomycetaceae bacterium]